LRNKLPISGTEYALKDGDRLVSTSDINGRITYANRCFAAAAIMHEITLASREQGQGIAEVNAAMAGLDAITRQNAALVQHSAGASNSLAQEAASLVKAMSVFRLPGGHETAARRTAPQLSGERGFHRQGTATAALRGGVQVSSNRMSPVNGGAGTRVTR
jgi:hypothetical protein